MEKSRDTDALIQEIILQYSKYGDEGSELIQKAYEYAKKAHTWVTRKSGEPYIDHPVAATRELMSIEPDLISIVATLVHDSVSDGSGTFQEIEANFWGEVRRIVEALDKIWLIKYRGNEATVERLQRTLIAMAQDVRSIFVKFADRIDNLRTLQYHENSETAKRIADESLSIYAPIAARLGLYGFKEIMETLSLRELDMDGYLHVAGELAHYTLEQDQFLTQSVEKIKKILPEKYRGAVTYRVKKPYSIYRKLKQQGTESIRDIYDVFALRIIVDDLSECYSVLGLIHGHFRPLSERFKDFIAVPKPNGYQSLHTTVLGFDGYRQPIEIQIRTKQMDQDAEQWTASHILYKTFNGETRRKDYQDLVQVTMDTLLEQWSLLWKKISLPTLFVFSPKGDVFELPHRSTPVDFAYAVHTNVGYHTVGARVNGKITTLDAPLHDGDIVEIITSPQAHPSAQWFDFVVSSKAKSQIGVEVKRLSGDRARIIERGRKMLFDTFKTAEIPLQDDLGNFSQYYGSVLDAKKQEELFYHIGQGMRKPWTFLPRKEHPKKVQKKMAPISTPVDVIIWGQKKIPHQMAQCCDPHFPDDVVAVLRTGWKCMVHCADCASLERANPKRLLSAYWQISGKGKVVSCSLLFHDVPWLLSRIARIFYEMGINIIDLNLSAQNDATSRIHVSIEIPEDDISFLDRLIERIQLHIPEYLLRDADFFDKEK